MASRDHAGRKTDAGLHAPMLAAVESDPVVALKAVRRAMSERGMSEADALLGYGVPGTAELLKASRQR